MSVANKFETFEGSEVCISMEFLRRDEDGRNVYHYMVHKKMDKNNPLLLHYLLAGDDLRSGCWTQDEPDCKEMIATLATFLQPGHGCYDSPAEAEFAEQYGEKLWMEVHGSFLGYHQLPGLGSVEIFHLSDADQVQDEEGEPLDEGCYWQACFPGCLPDGDPVGPFDTPFLAYEDWKRMD